MTTTEQFSMRRVNWEDWKQLAGLVLCLAFLAVVATLNIVGWCAHLTGLARVFAIAVSIICDGLVFLLWDKVRAHWRARNQPSAIGGFVLLIVAATYSVIGGHFGLEVLASPLRQSAAVETQAAQAVLDKRRADFELSEIAPIRARIDAVAKPDLSGGPLNDAQENARWRDATAADREALIAAQHRLDAIPLTADPKVAYDWRLLFLISGAFVAISIFGLTIFRPAEADAASIPQTTEARPKNPRRGRPQTIDDVTRARVKKLKKSGATYDVIEAETGVSRSQAQRIVKSA